MMDFPKKIISCGGVCAEICLPDAEKGYYRGTRFDWLGAFYGIQDSRHVWVEPWYDGFNPLRHDNLSGPSDEFMVVGADEPGDHYLKIGVGVLNRRPGEAYDRFLLYEIADRGHIAFDASENEIRFLQTLEPKLTDWGYRLAKTVSLLPGEARDGDASDARCAAVLHLAYALENTGRRLLEFDWYNHNFFTLDHQEVGPDTRVELPWTPEGHWRDPYQGVGLSDKGILFTGKVADETGSRIQMSDLRPAGGIPATGWTDADASVASAREAGPNCPRYGFRITNLRTGCGVEAEGTGRMDHAVFWSCPRVACMEPYVHFRILPGETSRWEMRYRLLGR